jgi:hypothetical protein
LAPSDPPAWRYADSSGASIASGAFDAFSALGSFGFADRLPDRTERNARRTGAPVAPPQVRNIRMNHQPRAAMKQNRSPRITVQFVVKAIPANAL